uniref:P3 protein n=1 Tax=Angiostrongylus cantonensis TaxID=6313 RepID=A0A0K0D3C5_ANGCA
MKIIVFQLSLTAAQSLNDLTKSAVITFEPQELHSLVEGDNETVSVCVKIPQAEFAALPDLEYQLSFGSFHPEVAYSQSHVDVAKSSFVHDNSSDFYTLSTEVIVHGGSIGKTGMRLRLVVSRNWSDLDDSWKTMEMIKGDTENILDVWVLRNEASERLTLVFVTSIVLLITFGNVLMGCELDLRAIFDTLKRPVAPTIGFLAQFFVMPVLAYSIAKSVFVSQGLFSMALGLFVTGCSPGGGASNFWTLLLDGNVNLSVTMTFISTLASLVVMPFWISMFGAEFLQGFSSKSNLRVPYGKIVRSLVSLVIPLLIGVAIKKLKPEWAAKSRKTLPQQDFII